MLSLQRKTSQLTSECCNLVITIYLSFQFFVELTEELFLYNKINKNKEQYLYIMCFKS